MSEACYITVYQQRWTHFWGLETHRENARLSMLHQSVLAHAHDQTSISFHHFLQIDTWVARKRSVCNVL